MEGDEAPAARLHTGTGASVTGGLVPSLDLSLLAASSDDGLDHAALSFLLADSENALLRAEEQRKEEREEEKMVQKQARKVRKEAALSLRWYCLVSCQTPREEAASSIGDMFSLLRFLVPSVLTNGRRSLSETDPVLRRLLTWSLWREG